MYQLFEKGDILNTPIECYEFVAGRESFPVRPHWHYFLELVLVVRGSLSVRSGDENYRLNEGELALFHPKTVHSIDSLSDTPPIFLGIKLDANVLNMNSAYIPKLRGILLSGERKNMATHFSKTFCDDNHIEDMFRECIREIHGARYGYDILLKASIYKVLISILREWQEKGFTMESETFQPQGEPDIYTVTEYIDKNLGNRVKVAEIAEALNMSYSSFSRKFLDVYGKPCKDYIEDMRLIKVEDYLKFTDFDLNYIAQETGYTDCSHMIKSFRAAKGMTPKQYRTKLK